MILSNVTNVSIANVRNVSNLEKGASLEGIDLNQPVANTTLGQTLKDYAIASNMPKAVQRLDIEQRVYL
jgi:hypothetical protein